MTHHNQTKELATWSLKITTRGYKFLTFTKSTTIMIAELTVMSGLGSSRDYLVLGVEWIGYGFGLACVDLYDL
jgi:hypothetical protein